jgi:hypothetical protein
LETLVVERHVASARLNVCWPPKNRHTSLVTTKEKCDGDSLSVQRKDCICIDTHLGHHFYYLWSYVCAYIRALIFFKTKNLTERTEQVGIMASSLLRRSRAC